jgi:hypothetical protein
MNEIAPRKQLGIIDYKNVPKNYVYIGRLPSPFSDKLLSYEKIADFFVGDGYLINRKEARKNGIVDSMPEQFEMPLAGVSWMINTIEQAFETPPSKGGLEKNKLHMDITIDSEDLELRYGVSVGGEGVGGYTIVNFDRSSYILPEASQQFSITVDVWKKVGRQFFKDILKRINSGEFN